MTAAELITVRPLDLTEKQLFILLANCIYDAQLNDGRHVRHAIDFRDWLMELASASSREQDILAAPLDRTTCDYCHHSHEGTRECGKWMGQGRFCRCELDVRV